MGKDSGVNYCDSSLNGMMGCDGCELWNPKTENHVCYAGLLTNRYKGSNGWPGDFNSPQVFPNRFNDLKKWPDLTGQKRPFKPWLNGMPRVIFHGDMGDYFTESLDIDWLKPYIPLMESTPHIHLLLTKRPKRMLHFFRDLGYVPKNFWLGTTVTSHENVGRSEILSQFKTEFQTAPVTFLSCEPLHSDIHLNDALGVSFVRGEWKKVGPRFIDWVIVGGESSGPASDLYWIENVAKQTTVAGAELFVKQLGTKWANEAKVANRKGENMDDWPRWLRIRNMPKVIGIGGNKQPKLWTSNL